MDMLPSVSTNILVVVVLYKRLLLSSETLCSLNKACIKANVKLTVLVYDNSPVEQESSHATSLLNALSLLYVHDPTNSGVAGAYNYGLTTALHLQLGKLWIFDQDSTLSEDFVEVTFMAVLACPDIDLYLPYVMSANHVVSPIKTFLGRSIGQRGLQLGINPSKEFFAINSGMLISVSYLSIIGGYDKRFKLYLTDNWFCDKFIDSRHPFFLTGAKMHHDLSRDSSKDINHLLSIYRMNLYGYKEIYKDRPLHFLVLTSFAIPGAVKRAIQYRDQRFLYALQELFKK